MVSEAMVNSQTGHKKGNSKIDCEGKAYHLHKLDGLMVMGNRRDVTSHIMTLGKFDCKTLLCTREGFNVRPWHERHLSSAALHQVSAAVKKLH